MKQFGFFTLAVVVVAIGAVLVLTQLTDGSSNVGEGDGSSTVRTRELDAGDTAQGLPSDSFEEPVPGAPNADGSFTYGGTDGTGGVGGGMATGGGSSAEGTGDGGGPVAPPLPSLADRKLVRDATVSLEVDSVGPAVGQVESIATAAGGFVASSSVFVDEPPKPIEEGVEPPERTESATITIRVPSESYAAVLAQLRDLSVEVRSETSTTSDVTEESTDLEARLRNLEATEVQYLALLEQAETIPDILTLQDRINGVRLEIETTQGRINMLNDLSDLASIVVQLAPPAVSPDEPSQGWAQEAWENAWEESENALEEMGTVAIAGGVVLIWLVIPLTAIAIGWRVFGPHRPRSGEA